jgi:hypothetical protein
MKAILTKIDNPRLSKHGGEFTRVYFKSIPENKTYRLDVYTNHTLSSRFIPFLKSQAMFEGLEIYKDNIINGCSNFKFIGIKNGI